MSAVPSLRGAPIAFSGGGVPLPPNMNIISECSTCHQIRVRATDETESAWAVDYQCSCDGLWAALGFAPKYALVVRCEEKEKKEERSAVGNPS